MTGPDPTLLNIFSVEQAEHVQHMRAALRELHAAPPEERAALLEKLLRRAHTLKGAARAVGLEVTEQVVHSLEGALALARRREAALDEGLVSRALDTIEDVLAAAQGRRSEPEVAGLLQALGVEEGAPAQPRTAAVRPPAEPPISNATEELVRVPASALDAIIRFSSELVTTAAGGSRAAEQISDHVRELDDAHSEYRRLRSACSAYLRRHPDGEAVRECLSFVDGQWDALRTRAARAAAAQHQSSWELRQHVVQLHESASRARMIPAESVFGAFGPMVRALAEEEGKQVLFRAEGLDVQADRLVLQRLKDPVMHLLRNAVSHGVERPGARVAAGKPPEGAVLLSLRARGDRLQVTVADDGAGIDAGAVAAEARRRGLLDDVGPSEQGFRVLFEPGFTTSRTVSEVSGRGMGLSAVREAVSRLRGEVLIRDAAPGTIAEISVPLSIATQHILLVEAESHTYALPGVFLAGVQRWTMSEIVLVEGRPSVVFQSEPVPLVRLATLLGVESGAPEASGRFYAAVVDAGGGRAAVVVDRVVDDREAIVRETGLGTRFAGLSAGAVALEDGTAAVMLDVAELLQQFLRAPGAAVFQRPPAPERKARILVVDDSITTRSVERNILESHGYEVEVAVDGLEALDKVRANKPDLIISDVAMPRLDGFELLERLKTGKDTAAIPVILVTSLETREEQERGLSLGADAYIVKRKFDQRDLLATVRQIL